MLTQLLKEVLITNFLHGVIVNGVIYFYASDGTMQFLQVSRRSWLADNLMHAYGSAASSVSVHVCGAWIKVFFLYVLNIFCAYMYVRVHCTVICHSGSFDDE